MEEVQTQPKEIAAAIKSLNSAKASLEKLYEKQPKGEIYSTITVLDLELLALNGLVFNTAG